MSGMGQTLQNLLHESLSIRGAAQHKPTFLRAGCESSIVSTKKELRALETTARAWSQLIDLCDHVQKLLEMKGAAPHPHPTAA